jgi:hypothetical protein
MFDILGLQLLSEKPTVPFKGPEQGLELRYLIRMIWLLLGIIADLPMFICRYWRYGAGSFNKYHISSLPER